MTNPDWTPEEEEAFNSVEKHSNLGKQILRGMGQPYHFEKREWDELTLAEVKEAYGQHAKYQIEDMGVSGWVEFADALQTILRNKNT